MHRNASLLHETSDVLSHSIGRFLCVRKVFDGVIPERADQAVGQCVKIDLEFTFCRGALAFFASAQIRMQDFTFDIILCPRVGALVVMDHPHYV